MKVAKRETAVLIRLSEREKRTLKRKAANYGMTVSDYARTLLINSDDATIKVIDTEPLKKTAHELAKQGTNLNQFMKFLNTYGIKVFDAGEAQRVLAVDKRHLIQRHSVLASPNMYSNDRSASRAKRGKQSAQTVTPFRYHSVSPA